MLQFSIEFASGERESNLGGAAGSVLRFHGRIMLGSFSERSRIMLGTVSDRSRIGNDTSAVFSKFVSDFGRSFFVAGAVFGEVGG